MDSMTQIVIITHRTKDTASGRLMSHLSLFKL